MSALNKMAIVWLLVAPWSIASSAIGVCGVIHYGEVWSNDDSPVHVTCDLSIAGLTVEPGVEVHVAGDYELVVSGVIRVMGTQNSPVIFKPAENNPSGWGGFFFEDTVDNSEFRWTEIEGATSSGVHLVRSYPSFDYVIFRNNSATLGGAIRAELLDNDLTVSNSHFVDNFARTAGGAIHVLGPTGVGDAALEVTESIFLQNNAGTTTETRNNTSGGAIHIEGNSRILRSTFSENEARAYTIFARGGRYTRGGAIYVAGGQSEIIASTFIDNACRLGAHSQTPDASRAYGGALYLASGELLLINSLLVENELSGGRIPDHRGSGLYVAGGVATVANSTMAYNSKHAVHRAGGHVEILNSILFFNNESEAQIVGPVLATYSDIQNGWSGEGNISLNPIFDEQFAIVPPSPAIDAGNPSSEFDDVIPPGQGTFRNDMGYTGGPDAVFLTGAQDSDGDGDPDLLDSDDDNDGIPDSLDDEPVIPIANACTDESVLIANYTYEDGENFLCEAPVSLTTEGAVIVSRGAAAIFVSRSIAVGSGFRVQTGGMLVVKTPGIDVPTGVCGLISEGEVWSIEDSPVHVTCDLSIAGLTVEPGVEVHVAGDYELVVSGVIRVMGTQNSPVIFKPAENNPSGWGGFFFEDTIDGSEFHWTQIEGATSSGVHLVRSYPSFDYVTFRSNSATHGGAIRAELLDNDLTVSNNLFVDNFASTAGGAIHVLGPTGVGDAALEVTESIFLQNNAGTTTETRNDTSGGAVHVEGNSRISCNTFSENEARAYTIFIRGGRYTRGGAIYAAGGQSEIIASTFIDNACRLGAHSQTPDASRAYGGALYLGSGELLLINSLLVENELSGGRIPDHRGSGLYVAGGVGTVVNSTMAYNSKHAVHQAGGQVEIFNSILFFNNDREVQIAGPVLATYSDIQNGWSGEGNISLNPIFDEQFGIDLPSPAIDAGNPSPEFNDVIPPGQGSLRNDMGYTGGPAAHHWNNPVCYGDADSDG